MMRAIDLKSSRDELLFTYSQDMGWPKLSPDGKQFAFNSAKNGPINIWTIPVTGGEAKQLTFDQELAGFPTWSPDGRFIALQLGRGQDSHIAIMPSEGGSPVQLTSDRGLTYSGSWSPDGSKITFAGERNGVWNIWWVSVKDKSEKKLTNYTKINAYVRGPAWSPLDNQIIYEYAETRGNIWMMELK